ncbi:MAG: type II toxin-antitoxin system HicB family antitoxin [Dehalococcoidales bacterium]
MKTRGYVVLTLKFQKQGRRWTALCEELGTATFGRSLPEADQRLKEAIHLHLDTLEDVGERECFFKEHNIQLHQEKPQDNIIVCLPVNREVFIEPLIQAIPALRAA